MEKTGLVLYLEQTDIFAQFPSPMPFAMFEDLGKYLLIAFVVFLGVLAWRAWQIRQASPQWPYVEGEMVSTRCLHKTKPGATEGSQRMSGTPRCTTATR